MSPEEIVAWVEGELPGTVTVVASADNDAPETAWGDIFFIYDPDQRLAPDKQFPYATIVVSDYPGFDEASALHRDGVFRVNVWVSPETFRRTVGEIDDGFDYTVLDEVIPHPVYAKQSWLSVLNPGEATAETVELLLAEAHQRAKGRYEKQAIR